MMDELERIANAKYNRGHISKVSQLHRQSVTSRASCDAKKEIKNLFFFYLKITLVTRRTVSDNRGTDGIGIRSTRISN